MHQGALNAIQLNVLNGHALPPVLNSIKRWIAGETTEGSSAVLSQWARLRGWRFAQIAGAQCSMAERRKSSQRVRIEWGVSQRPYLGMYELRIRSSLSPVPSAQLAMFSEVLLEPMMVYRNSLLQNHQAVDHSTSNTSPAVLPTELDWIERYPKLRLRWGMDQQVPALISVANSPSLGKIWVGNGVAQQLWTMLLDQHNGSRAIQLENEQAPPPIKVILTLSKGKLTLRLGIDRLDESWLDWAVQTHQMAMVCFQESSPAHDPAWPTTASAMWVESVSNDELSRF